MQPRWLPPPVDSEAYVGTERQGPTVHVACALATLSDKPLHAGLDRLWIWLSLYVGETDADP